MDNKAKSASRIKNNAKPSSSSRSAELLASQKSVCFPTQVQKTLMAPADNYLKESTAKTGLHIAIRKLNKKDPITKKKALEELVNNINYASLEEVEQILPLWSKIYLDLAYDPTHNVRELTQVVHAALASKCKRMMAPYLKQLVPVWLFSHFDNYTPAANIARSSFYDSFNVKSNRIQEVCLHCQFEILGHISDNLSKSSVISNKKNTDDGNLTQNMIYGSLEMLSFFTEHTKTSKLTSKSYMKLRSILEHANFWNYGKRGSKLSSRAAWFKVIHNLVQNSFVDEMLLEWKWNLIEVCFDGIDECDRTLASHIWKCILLLQSKYDDWYKHLNFKTVIQPKLSRLLQNKFFNNFETICPNMLPFCEALVNAYFQDLDWQPFLEQYLMELKNVFCSETLNAKEADYNAIFDAYFDCWKFILNKLNRTDAQLEQQTIYAFKILHTNIMHSTAWLLMANKNTAITSYLSMTIKMLTDWQNQRKSEDNGLFYTNLLSEFWNSIFHLIKTLINENEHYPEGIIELIHSLVRLNEGKVSTMSPQSFTSKQPDHIMENNNEDRIKKIALQLIQHCLKKVDSKECKNCIKHVQTIMDMFPDIEFYKNVTNSCDISESIDSFVDLISVVDKEFHMDIAEIIFKMVTFLDAEKHFLFIKTHIFSICSREIQTLLLQDLLLNHLKIGKHSHIFLSGPDVRALIIDLTKNALVEKSIGTTNWPQILFLQNDVGDFLVGAATVDAFLNTIFEPLEKEKNDHEIVELCANIISQIMPTVFNTASVFLETKSRMFLKLFKFLMEQHSIDSFLSADTLHKLTFCWENVLSNENIVTEETILNCIHFVKTMQLTKKCILQITFKSAGLIIRFIMGTIRGSATNEERATKLNKLIVMFLASNDISELKKQLTDYCLFLEELNGFVSTKNRLYYQEIDYHNIYFILQRLLLNIYIIKQICEKIDEIKSNLSSEDLTTLDSNLCYELLNCITLTNAGESVLRLKSEKDASVKICVDELQEQIRSVISNNSNMAQRLYEMLLQNAKNSDDTSYCRSLYMFVFNRRYEQFEENAAIILTEEMFDYFSSQDALTPYINFLQYQLPRLGHRSISVQNLSVCAKSTDVWIKCATLHCFVVNFFTSNLMEKGDESIVAQVLGLVREIYEILCTEKRALFDVEIDGQNFVVVVEVAEYIRLLTEILRRLPWSLSSKDWDIIIIGLSSWIQSVLKSIKMFTDFKVALFTINVCRLFTAFEEFIKAEQQISSTALVRKTIDEWTVLFTKDVYCAIFKSFYELLQLQESATFEYFSLVFDELRKTLLFINFDNIYILCKNLPEDSFTLLLRNFSNSNTIVQRTCYYVVRKLTKYFVIDDIKYYETLGSNLTIDGKKQHYLQQFDAFVTLHDPFVEKYIAQFSFKISEIDEFEAIDSQKAFSYLLLWDCIIHACVKSPLFVRTMYTSWLFEKKYAEKFLHFLIRAMPIEILKYHDSRHLSSEIFNSLTWAQINDENLTLEKYACHLYTEVLKKLPAVVRRWWNISPSRQKAFVDKLTTNFVSPLICDEELKSIGANKERPENMQVTVHISTREVLAVYFMDEVRTELAITLPPNYPLRPVTVDCGKNIGGRLSSRNIMMQLALFLTHQNGTILDGLALWKNSLDKKFEGVEECYVCYTVIHQDTCQLPKLTCKTCKKKFHGSCLYKWFTTSSKSTCPICRNVF